MTATTTTAAPPAVPAGTRRRGLRRRLAAVALAVALPFTAAPAQAVAANPYERGPAPTVASIEASRGSFAVSTTTVSRLVSGFGGGTLYYPSTTSAGTFGAVVVAPGYTASQSSTAWLGPRLASQGFVVFTIDTSSRYDQPASRGRQLQAAADYLVSSRSGVANRVDAGRIAVMGHSMGGGGVLEAVKANPRLRAAIPLTPWNTDKTWPEITTPTLVIGAQNDSVASVRTHSIPFYTSIPASTDKAYVELRGASHFAPNTSNTLIARSSIAWLKRFVDDDLRYSQFLCAAPGTTTQISDYRDTCPY